MKKPHVFLDMCLDESTGGAWEGRGWGAVGRGAHFELS